MRSLRAVSPACGRQAGSFSADPNVQCAGCAEGQYQPSIGKANCEPCRLGTYCGPSATEPDICPAGYFCPTPATKLPCALGGAYCPVTRTDIAAQTEGLCPPGFHCADSTSPAEPCAEGSYCPSGSAQEVLCPIGFFCTLPSDKKPCGGGTECAEGSTSPTACSAGRSSPAESAVRGVPCKDCAAGEFQASSGQASCKPCTVGAYCPLGSAAEGQCPAGFFCPTPATKLPCTLGGAYCPVTRTLAAAQSEGLCPAGFHCADTTSPAEPCAEGSYCPLGSAQEVPCPVGFFCTLPSDKKPCGEGTECAEGSTSPTACSAGRFSAVRGVPCEDCAAGKFQASSGQASCKPCTVGAYCPLGSAAEGQCPAGFFCPVAATKKLCTSRGAYCPGTRLAAEAASEGRCPAAYWCATAMERQRVRVGFGTRGGLAWLAEKSRPFAIESGVPVAAPLYPPIVVAADVPLLHPVECRISSNSPDAWLRNAVLVLPATRADTESRQGDQAGQDGDGGGEEPTLWAPTAFESLEVIASPGGALNLSLSCETSCGGGGGGDAAACARAAVTVRDAHMPLLLKACVVGEVQPPGGSARCVARWTAGEGGGLGGRDGLTEREGWGERDRGGDGERGREGEGERGGEQAENMPLGVPITVAVQSQRVVLQRCTLFSAPPPPSLPLQKGMWLRFLQRHARGSHFGRLPKVPGRGVLPGP